MNWKEILFLCHEFFKAKPAILRVLSVSIYFVSSYLVPKERRMVCCYMYLINTLGFPKTKFYFSFGAICKISINADTKLEKKRYVLLFCSTINNLWQYPFNCLINLNKNIIWLICTFWFQSNLVYHSVEIKILLFS